MELLTKVLGEISAGKTSFQPDDGSPEALDVFEAKAQAILAAERRGYVGKVLPHHASRRGRKLIDHILITEGLTFEGREFLENSASPINAERPSLTTPTEMRDHSPEQIRSMIVDILAGRERVRLESKQFSSLEEGVKEVLSRREGLHDGNPTTRNFALLSENDRNTFFDVFETLKHDGIIVDGLNRDNPGPPFFRLTKKGMRVINDLATVGPEIAVDLPLDLRESLARFREDHPDTMKVAFIMMRFGRTPAHERITSTLKTVLQGHGITALRADDKEYHDDLFANIRTYMHGCTFGIAVLERLEGDEFNPNVSLEIGYLLALRKAVLLLKDQTLRNLHTDLVGKLYRSFDPQDIEPTIEREISRWLRDWKLIAP